MIKTRHNTDHNPSMITFCFQFQTMSNHANKVTFYFDLLKIQAYPKNIFAK